MLPDMLPVTNDPSVLALIKEQSGRRIETRRRRDGVSQRKLAAAVGLSQRWLREIEAGITTAALEDHIRCAHALGMSSAHIFVPLLFAEHDLPIPRELLMVDDLWDVERACLEILREQQSLAQSRQAFRSRPCV
jgi:transcriptional regulator with XRE-family HTH domain